MSKTKDAPHSMRSPLPMSRRGCVGAAHRTAKPSRRAVLKGMAAAAVAFISGAAASDTAIPKPIACLHKSGIELPPTLGTFPGCILMRDRYGRHLWQLAVAKEWTP